MRNELPPRIFITAGEPSGDAHAARLMRQLRLHIPDVVFEGFGGPAMELEGLHSLASIRDLAVTGFVEVAKRYRYFTNLLETCQRHIERSKPLAFIPVDYPGFNLRLARRVRSPRLPVIWYIAPQLWAWGKRRAPALAAAVDRLLVVFPFEVEFFSRFGIRAEYVGHPLMEALGPPTVRRPSGPILLMPGSRSQELQRHVPILTAAMERVRASDSNIAFVVPRAAGVAPSALQPLADAGAAIVDNAAEAIDGAWAGMIKAGTSTLEATLRGLPYGSFYRTSFLSYHLSKALIDVPSITLMNLLLQRNVVHEYIQSDATPEAIAREIADLSTNLDRRQELTDAMLEIRHMLSSHGASQRAAEIIRDMVQRKRG
ncbi:MAG: lipid-A-disaccharide synthase [Candidatus Kapabacteria bacterium]|nr:lipid-A-disaccharide synthase [Candidatus Kapabacteria bacterium]